MLSRYARYVSILLRWTANRLSFDKPQKHSSLTSLLSSELFQHACKTPLSVLLCNLETVVENGKPIEDSPNTKQDKLVFDSFLAAKRLKNLLAHADDPNSKCREVFDIANTIKQVVVFVRARFPNVTISTTVGEALITGNKLYLQEALQCLLVNAVEAQKGNSGRKPFVIIHSEAVSEQRYRIDIIDFGKGMTKAEAKLALLKGITYKKSGSGLGLPFAIETIENHFQGKIYISSTVEIGTRISIEMPL